MTFERSAATLARAAGAADPRRRDRRPPLDDEDHALLVLRVNRGLAWQDIGLVVGVDAATARKRFQRLKDRLRRDAQRAGLLDAD